MIVLGDNQKFASAIISPSFEALENFCIEHNIESKSREEMIAHPKVIEEYQRICDKLNPHFGHVEQIKKFRLVADTWDVATGELTPTMKLKRRVLMDKYAGILKDIYEF